MTSDDAPPERARARWSVPPPPNAEPPASNDALGEEFLYHLYRGSELLKEDQFYEAKTELERALAVQPRDIEGQSLLGIVYFRLGHYPRAIQIYEELARVRPTDVTPRINLALCYLKTGQLPNARAVLEDLVQERPDHLRAWGYLGLAYQRLGDFHKAAVAFERAGRSQLASRLRATHEEGSRTADTEDGPPAPRASVHEISHEHVRQAQSLPPPPPDAQPPVPSTPPRPSRGAPGPHQVRVPVPLARTVRDATLVFPDAPRFVVHADGVVLGRIDSVFHTRSEYVRSVLPDAPDSVVTRVLKRRGRGLAEEPLGGVASPFATLEGSGRLVLAVEPPFLPFAAILEGEPLYVREERLVGFDGSIEHESGRLVLPEGGLSVLIQLVGSGIVVLSVRGPLHGIEVSPARPANVRAARVVGWTGRLLSRPAEAEDARAPIRGLLTLSGTGTALLDAT